MIKGLTLEINGKEIVIPMEQARELYNDLDVLFGEKSKITYPPTYRDPFDTTKWTNPMIYGDRANDRSGAPSVL